MSKNGGFADFPSYKHCWNNPIFSNFSCLFTFHATWNINWFHVKDCWYTLNKRSFCLICEWYFMKSPLLPIHITWIPSAAFVHIKLSAEPSKWDTVLKNRENLPINRYRSILFIHWFAAYTSLCISTRLKDGIFCRNRHHHAGFVKTGFFQKTASFQGKMEFFPYLFIT